MVVKPVVLYGLETVALKKRQEAGGDLNGDEE